MSDRKMGILLLVLVLGGMGVGFFIAEQGKPGEDADPAAMESLQSE